MAEAIVTGAFGLFSVALGFVLERRYGHRIDDLERRVGELEHTDDTDDTHD